MSIDFPEFSKIFSKGQGRKTLPPPLGIVKEESRGHSPKVSVCKRGKTVQRQSPLQRIDNREERIDNRNGVMRGASH